MFKGGKLVKVMDKLDLQEELEISQQKFSLQGCVIHAG
jgi:hypothetical protein